MFNSDSNSIICENEDFQFNTMDNGFNNSIEQINKLNKFVRRNSFNKNNSTEMFGSEPTADRTEFDESQLAKSISNLEDEESSLNASYVSNLEIMVDNLNENTIEDAFINSNFNENFAIFNETERPYYMSHILSEENEAEIVHEYYGEDGDCDNFIL